MSSRAKRGDLVKQKARLLRLTRNDKKLARQNGVIARPKAVAISGKTKAGLLHFVRNDKAARLLRFTRNDKAAGLLRRFTPRNDKKLARQNGVSSRGRQAVAISWVARRRGGIAASLRDPQ